MRAISETIAALEERFASANVHWPREVLLSLVDRIRKLTEHPGVPLVGLAGPPGSGKSTLAKALARWCRDCLDLRLTVVSLDDFYLSKADRDQFPAWAPKTRGVPGTHDALLLQNVLNAIRAQRAVSAPVFDKGRDDRIRTRRIEPEHDLVLLEGWCVGAPPMAEAPSGDQGLAWSVSQFNALYAPLWEQLTQRWLLSCADFNAILRWRCQQERQVPEECRMSESEVRHFLKPFWPMIQHVEQRHTDYDFVVDIQQFRL